MIKRALLALAIAGPTFAHAENSAPGAGGQQHERVVLEDLNLSSAAGAEEALERVQRTAMSMCAWRGSVAHPRQMRGIRRCVADAVDDAVARLDAPLVSALHAARPRQ